MPVIIRCGSAGQDVVCPTPIMGGALLRALGQSIVILAKIEPLAGGSIYRTFRRVTLDDEFHLLDLYAYTEVYTPDRRLFGHVETALPPQSHAGEPQRAGGPEHALECQSPALMPNLPAIYATLQHVLPWPAPLPRPEQVTFRWNTRFRRTHATCWPSQQRIDVSDVYQDERLAHDLEHLMTHEAAHFLWHGHPKAFKAFLRSVGVPEEYVHGTSPRVSALYRAVAGERRPRHDPSRA